MGSSGWGAVSSGGGGLGLASIGLSAVAHGHQREGVTDEQARDPRKNVLQVVAHCGIGGGESAQGLEGCARDCVVGREDQGDDPARPVAAVIARRRPA